MTTLAVVLVLAAPTLEQAFEREAALLGAEAAELQNAITALEAKRHEQHKNLASQIEALTGELIALRAGNDALDAELLDTTPVAGPAVGDDVLTALLERGGARLQSLAPKTPRTIDTTAEDSEQISLLITSAVETIERRGHAHVEHDVSVFDSSGRPVTSSVLHLARVATFLLPSGTPLAPVGDAGLRATSLAAAGDLSASQSATLATALIYDPNNPGTSLSGADARDLIGTFKAGGLVMWPIALLALIALFVSIERALALWRSTDNADQRLLQVERAAGEREWEAAANACGARPLGSVLRVVLDARGEPPEQLEERATVALMRARRGLERFLGSLNVIAMVAPLLGLLGTVTGMISTFVIITEFGTGDPQLLAGGISQALLTTQFGLAVAIPTLVVHAIFSRWSERLQGEAQRAALQLIAKMAGAQAS